MTRHRPELLAAEPGRDRGADPPVRPRRRGRQRPGRRPADDGREASGLPVDLPAQPAQPRRRGRLRARACCTPSRWAPTGSGAPTTTAARPTTTCWPPCSTAAEQHGLAEVSPDGDRHGRSRAAGLPAAPRTALAAAAQRLRRDRDPAAATPRCSTARSSAPTRSTSSACPTTGCSSAATRPRSTAGCVRAGLPFGTCVAGRLPAPRGDDGVPADPRRPALRAVPRRTRSSATSPTATAAT